MKKTSSPSPTAPTSQKIAETKNITLYKYIHSNHLENILRTGKIKVTQLSHSNDPLEFLPAFPSQNADTQNAWLTPMHNYEPLVICLTTKISSPAMWGHYADSHKGICIAFEIPIEKHIETTRILLELPQSSRIYKCLGTQLLKVFYSDHRAPYFNHQIPSSSIKAKGVIARCIIAKSSEWSYEQEYRLLVDNKTLHPDNGMLFDSELSKYISGIILGNKCNLSETYIERVLSISNPSSKPIKIKRAKFSDTLFKIEAEDFKDTNVHQLDTWMADN